MDHSMMDHGMMDHSGHTMTGGSSSGADAMSMMHAMMVPYFHFTPGDTLFFKGWIPTSDGAIAGACIGLFFFALLERILCATRKIFEAHWMASRKALAESRTSSIAAKGVDEFEGGVANAPTLRESIAAQLSIPFNVKEDALRGLFSLIQILFGYVLMLAVMTYRVDYIICIIFGHAFGELFFGRYGGGGHHDGGHSH